MQGLLKILSALPTGHVRGRFEGRSYGVTVNRAAEGRNIKLYASELGGRDRISFNLYILSSGSVLLKPCEMAEEKVLAFVEGFVPDRLSGNVKSPGLSTGADQSARAGKA